VNEEPLDEDWLATPAEVSQQEKLEQKGEKIMDGLDRLGEKRRVVKVWQLLIL